MATLAVAAPAKVAAIMKREPKNHRELLTSGGSQSITELKGLPMSNKYSRTVNRPRQERWFRCPECGLVFPAHKWRARFTAAGHIKTMWCWRCQKVQDFVQLKEEEICVES